MGKAVTTKTAKKNMLLARAGMQTLPKVKWVAFGDGGIDTNGDVRTPYEDQESLNAEISRKEVQSKEVVSDTEIVYKVTLAAGELTGKKISEIALIDENGNVITIKTFRPKVKDEDVSLTFSISDVM